MRFRREAALCLVTASVVASVASAQFAADNVGIYFDEAATTNGVSFSGPGEVHAYLVVTGCTLSNPMTYYWGGVRIGAPYAVVLRAGGTNAHTLIPDGDGVVRIAATFGTPLEIAEAIVVADLFIEVASDEEIRIWCENNDSPAGWAYEMQGAGAEPWEVVRLWQSTERGAAPSPPWPWFAACINGAPPVADAATTWGAVKSRYR